MDTKRCAYCSQLPRADAEICSLCGHAFTPRPQGINRIVMLSEGAESMGRSAPGGNHQGRPVSVTMSMHQRSIPPASPHRAGHYSGLHPEDQPYQSTMLAVQRPPESQAHPPVQKEPAIEYLPAAPDPLPDDAALSSWSTAASQPTEVQTQVYGRPAP